MHTTQILALDPEFGAQLGKGIGAIALYAIVGLALILAGFYAIDWTTPGKLSDLVRTGKPNAVLITSAGLVSMAFIIVLAITSSASDLTAGLITSLVYGLLGIIVQVAAVRILEWATRINIGEVIQAEKFTPASVVVAAAHVALGLVVAVAIS
ncbi:DUF350 domain-containing protein [Kibdelosporangium phytohabitans]|uniref:DUF350 domain-containing protein n=1 Tax=Kibdelosporangium phytohabitans TaxID=860235 RepID=A0A0N9HUC2_9PSEU|nr:DUF350 domain-containing protein [Kibdelosporangium phytohabitans]ALG05666.1 hypothetical protein AOZ06_00840 [Kibdelosporangium phytohabitans]MBE1466354.1 uncharacterized membrane protein YjfL (UPF0719 family) [Kibdelosporangium phytohabitans]